MQDRRHRGGRQECRADPLADPAGHEGRGAVGQAGAHRGGGEDGEPDQDHAPAAEHVGQAAAEQEEAAERHGVGRDGPAGRAPDQTDVEPDLGECDVHDGDVEHEHRLGEAEQRQGDPAPPVEARGVAGVGVVRRAVVGGSRGVRVDVGGDAGARGEVVSSHEIL